MVHCPHCNRTFEESSKKFGAHVGNCSLNPKRAAFNERQHSVKRQSFGLTCQKCGAQYELELTQSQFEKGKYRKNCSRSCANGRPHSEGKNLKISQTLRDRSHLGHASPLKGKSRKSDAYYTRACIVCKRQFVPAIRSYSPLRRSGKRTCSDECAQEALSQAGRKSAQIQSERRRSKNEIEFAENVCALGLIHL